MTNINELMYIGASLILKTVQAIEQNSYPQVDQSELLAKGEKEKHAPKIFKEDCKIDWAKSATEIHNFIRGLSPYPAAFSSIKVFGACFSFSPFTNNSDWST